MNKSTLFLFSLFSVINFPCNGMETTKNTLHTIIRCVRGQNAEPHIQKQEIAKENFSNQMDSLSQAPKTLAIRQEIIPFVQVIRKETAPIVRAINAPSVVNKAEIEESFRLKCMDAVINALPDLTKITTYQDVRRVKHVIITLAEFSQNKYGHTRLLNSDILFDQKNSSQENYIERADIEAIGNADLLAYFDSRLEHLIQQQTKEEEAIKIMLETVDKNTAYTEDWRETLAEVQSKKQAEVQPEPSNNIIQKEEKQLQNSEALINEDYCNGLDADRFVMELQRIVKRNREQRESLEKIINEQESTLGRYADEMNKFPDKIKELKEELQARLDEANKNNNTITEQNKANLEQIAELNQAIQKLNNAKENLEELNRTFGETDAKKTQALETLEKDFADTNKKITALNLQKKDLETRLATTNQDNLTERSQLEQKLASVYFRIKVCAGVSALIAAVLVYYLNLHTKGIELLSQLNPSLS